MPLYEKSFLLFASVLRLNSTLRPKPALRDEINSRRGYLPPHISDVAF
jgi:hypothetical protein